MKLLKKLQYNSPVVLTFSLLSFIVLIFGIITGGKSTSLLFCVYRSSLLDPLTYVRFFTHVLGHSSYSHYIGNILLILVAGPPLEEKYGSATLVMAIVFTAFVSGLVQFILFPNTALLGASGIVFMMIVMLSFSGMKAGKIPITLILVFVFYLGGEIVDGLSAKDNISQLTHIVGGICGAIMGFALAKRK